MTPKPQEVDYYQVLGVESDVSDNDLTRAYRKLALKYHPDKSDNSSGDAFKRITEAYNVLHDPEKRKCYDHQRDALWAFHPGFSDFKLQRVCEKPLVGAAGKDSRSYADCTTAWSCEDLNLGRIFCAVNMSGELKRYKPSPIDKALTPHAPCSIPANTPVVLHSFHKSVQHNGCEARVRSFDQETGRYDLVMDGCCSFAVKPENMTQKCAATIHGLHLHPQLNGKDVQIMGFDAGRYVVSLPNTDATLTLKPGNAILKPGTSVRLQGLRQAELNGKMVTICSVDLDACRYSVECADGRQIRVRYENAVC